MDGMSFGQALLKCKQGARITRAAWESPDMHVFFQPGGDRTEPRLMATGRDGRSAYWYAAHADLLADDWQTL